MPLNHKSIDGCEMLEVPANPGYYRVPYNESKFDSMKLKNGGISLEQAISNNNRKLIVSNADLLETASEYEDDITQDDIDALESIDDGLDEVLEGLGEHFCVNADIFNTSW